MALPGRGWVALKDVVGQRKLTELLSEHPVSGDKAESDGPDGARTDPDDGLPYISPCPGTVSLAQDPCDTGLVTHRAPSTPPVTWFL